MKKNTHKIPVFFCTATTLLINSTLHAAGVSPINITLSSGANSNTIATYAGQTTIVEYKLQDVIGRPPSRTWLWASPIPAYLTRTQALHQPDCSIYNQPGSDPNSFTLPPNGSCYFAFQVNGTQFATQGTAANYRPLFTNSGGIAYGPCESESMHISVTQAPPPPPPVVPIAIAVGSYTDMDDLDRPLLVATQDLGTTWTYPGSIPDVIFTPDTNYYFNGPGQFNAASCTGSTCIAVGVGEDTNKITSNYKNRPLLAISHDSGITWNYPESIITPVLTTNPFQKQGKLFAASCSGSTCIASGYYYDPAVIQRPLLAVSQNAGVTWTYSDSITTPVFTPNNIIPFLDRGSLDGASCSGNTCIAAGSYQDAGSVWRPLLASSQNAGGIWVYPEEITMPQFFPTMANPTVYPFVDGSFLSASCSGNTCIAAGSYNDGTTQRPLLAVSQDSGISWSFPNSIADPAGLTSYPFVDGGRLSGASCSGSTCIAAGTYSDGTNAHALLALSQDSGTTWNYLDAISAPTLPTTFDGTVLNAASCSGNTCIATGSYYDSVNEYPFVVSSRDSGTTWTALGFMTSINSRFDTANCTTNFCIAAGSFNDSSIYRPFLASSTDSGLTWNVPTSIQTPVFTPSINPSYAFKERGFFYGTASSSGSNALLPDSLKFVNQTAHQSQQHYIFRPSV